MSNRIPEFALLALLCTLAVPQLAGAVSAPPPSPPEPVVEPVVERNPDLCSSERPGACLDGVGGGVTSLDSLRVNRTGLGSVAASAEERARQQARGVVPGLVSGMSASAGSIGAWTLWGSGSLTAYEGEVAIAPYENRIDTGAIRVGTVATPGATLVGSYDADRASATINLNAVRTFGDWVLGGRIGALHAVESQDDYTETGGGGARTVGKRHLDLTQAYASVDL